LSETAILGFTFPFEELVSTDYASTALLFPDSDAGRVRERERGI